MRTGRARGGRLAAVALAVTVGVLGVSVGTALAHDPIIITDRQTSPDTGPVLLDGTISFALYGVVHGADDTRGFRVTLGAGDRLSMSVLVPALDPEQSLGPDELPTLQVARPDGSTFDVRPTESVVFDEAFSKTRYVRLAEVDEAAQAGEYRVTIVGHAPARFTVAVGSQERFGTPVEQVDDRNAGVGGVQAWYATPPAAAPPPTTPLPATTASATTVVDAPVSAVDATATAPTDAPDTTPAADTVPPVAASDTSDGADVTSSVPGAAPTTAAQNASGAAGSAVFFGAIGVIVAVGVVLYLRRTRR